MDRNFEVFTQRRSQATQKMRVAIRKRGNITLNKSAYEQLGEPGKVLLLYDRQSRAVGIKPTQDDVRYAFPVRRLGAGSTSVQIGAKSFCQNYGIELSGITEFEPVLEEGVLVIELDKGEKIASVGRRDKREVDKAGHETG